VYTTENSELILPNANRQNITLNIVICTPQAGIKIQTSLDEDVVHILAMSLVKEIADKSIR